MVGLSFKDKVLAEKVYKKSTWTFHGGILITEKWPTNGNWKEATLNEVECWINMKGFSPNALTINNMKRLGSMVEVVSKSAEVGKVGEIRGCYEGKVILGEDKKSGESTLTNGEVQWTKGIKECC
ncbi:hypothetical protein F8388_011177 [Cannabis sativa]|uniref:DUF4283 domain-containing protein n=1 Tax=Cannabis sativa TaxID=3483 RepID=A0A7J6EI90_CANSA|nr:hypothetical protein F8388_011177 [Cannabis sativa]